MESDKQAYVSSATFKLKRVSSLSSTSSTIAKEKQRPAGLRRIHSSSVLVAGAGLQTRTPVPTERFPKTRHVSSVSLSLRKTATGRASSEPKVGDFDDVHPGSVEMLEGVGNRSEAVLNYPQITRRLPHAGDKGLGDTSDTTGVVTAVERTLEDAQSINDDRDAEMGVDNVENGIQGTDEGKSVVQSSTSGGVVSRSRVDLDETRGSHRRTSSDTEFVAFASKYSRERTNGTRPRSQEVDTALVLAVTGSGNAFSDAVVPHVVPHSDEEERAMTFNLTRSPNDSATLSLSDENRGSGDNDDISLSDKSDGDGLCLEQKDVLEAPVLSGRDDYHEVFDSEAIPPRKGGMPIQEIESPTSPDVVNSNAVSSGSKEICTLGPQNGHAPDVHLYNDQNGRLHVVVDASKFSSTLSPNVVSGIKATVSDSSNGEALSSQELAESTHITLRPLRRRTSLSQAMENSVMPAWKEAIHRRVGLQKEEFVQEESCSTASPQVPVKKPASIKNEIKRANSVDVILSDSLDVEPPLVRNRSGSDRLLRQASASSLKTEEGQNFLNKPSRNSIAEVQLTDLSSNGSHKQSALTITAPGGSKVILRPPVKSKNDLTEEDMRQHVLMNLVETEISYVRSLKTLIQVYFEPLKKPRTPTLIDASLVDEIFYQIPNLRSCHEVFLKQLTDRVSEWHNQQKIGDIFVNQFSKCMLSDAYAAFINHYLQAKEAVRMAAIQRPAFSKFLEHCSREHSDKLTLNDLLIQPVQRIPRYVLLLKDMLKHTPQDHPDHHHLLAAVSELTTLAEKMDQGEWEAAEAEKLKELESTFEGHVTLTETKRYVLCQDTVGQVLDYEQIKERTLILLSDFVVCAAVRRSRGSTFRKRGSSLFSLGLSPSPNLFEIKHKLLWKASFSDITLIKSLEASVPIPYTSLVLPPSLTGGSTGRRTSVTEKSTLDKLHHDSACLQQITKIVKHLYIHHAQLDAAVRELESEVREQIEIQKQTELQLSLVKARLGIVLHNSGESLPYTLQFSSEQRKKAWIEEFEEAKKKRLAAEDTSITWNAPITASSSSSDKDSLSKDKVFSPSEPQFHKCIPLMKTRSGMRISCAATSISPVMSPNGCLGSGNLWICASDGCVGQVGIVTIKGSSPNEMVCITVCACRITCVLPVPELDLNCQKERRESTVGPLRRLSTDLSVHRSSSDLVRDRGRVPVIVRRTQSFGDRSRSSSQPLLTQREEEYSFRFPSLTLASSCMRLYGQRQGEMSELFEQLSSLPGPESEACLYPEETDSDVKTKSSVDIHTHETSPSLSASSPLSSPARALADSAIAYDNIPEEPVFSQQAFEPDLQTLKGPSMWLGTEDGSVLVYHASDSIKVRQKKMKIEFGSAVVALSYMKDRIFVSLEGHVMYAISRSEDGGWDIDSKEKVIVGDGSVSVTCMRPVIDSLWCGGENMIYVISPESLQTERFFQAHNDPARMVTHITSAGLAAWIAFQKSSEIKLFNAYTLQQLAIVDVRPEVKRILQGSNSIVRQHKIAQLRVTCLQPCEGLLWIGTSAGAMLTLRMPVIEEDTTSVLELPSLSSSYHGHTGLVRFVTAIRKPADEADNWTQYDENSMESMSRCVSLPKLTKIKSKEEISLNLNIAHARTLSETSQRAASECTLYSKSESSFDNDQGTEAPVEQQIVVVSGGDGFEDFRTSGDDQVAGRDDSTSHILSWLI